MICLSTVVFLAQLHCFIVASATVLSWIFDCRDKGNLNAFQFERLIINLSTMIHLVIDAYLGMSWKSALSAK